MHPILPSLFKLGNFVCFRKTNFIFGNPFRCFHLLQVTRLHEKGKCAPRNALPSYFVTSNHTVRCCFQKSSCMNLGRLSKLKSQHRWGNWNFSHFTKPVLSEKAPAIGFQGNLFSLCIDVHCWSKPSQGAMVIMPATPIILCISSIIKWEVIEHSPDMVLSSLNDSSKVVFFIRRDFLLG